MKHTQETSAELAQERPEEFDPMMNYAYPIALSDPEQAQAALVGTCLVVVHIHDGFALALAGGGMDLSWENREAFAILGYAPPLHFTSLPRMSGRGENERDRAILGACIQSAEIAAGWALRSAEQCQAILIEGEPKA